MDNSSESQPQLVCNTVSSIRTITTLSLFPISTVGNLLLLRGIWCNKELRSIISFRFIANLSVCDLSFIFLTFPLTLTLRHHPTSEKEAEILQEIYEFSLWSSVQASVLTLLAMSLEKVIACRFPLKHESWTISQKSRSSITLIWGISFSMSCLVWVDNAQLAGYNCMKIRPIFDLIQANVLSLSLVVVMLSNSYLFKLSNRHRQLTTGARIEAFKENYKTAKSVLLLVLMFGVCLIPRIVFIFVVNTVGCQQIDCHSVREYLTLLLILDINLRFVMYCMRFKSLARAIRCQMRCMAITARIAPSRTGHEHTDTAKRSDHVKGSSTNRGLNQVCIKQDEIEHPGRELGVWVTNTSEKVVNPVNS